jgi:hypothetical protein
MADIDIVPKRNSMTWVWVLLAIVLVAFLVWAMMGRGDAPGSGSLHPDGRSPGAAPIVEQFRV